MRISFSGDFSPRSLPARPAGTGDDRRPGARSAPPTAATRRRCGESRSRSTATAVSRPWDCRPARGPCCSRPAPKPRSTAAAPPWSGAGTSGPTSNSPAPSRSTRPARCSPSTARATASGPSSSTSTSRPRCARPSSSPLTISQRSKGLFGTVLSAPGSRPSRADSARSPISTSRSAANTPTEESVTASSAPAARPQPGSPGAVFTLARGSFYFADGKRIDTTLARDCRVR